MIETVCYSYLCPVRLTICSQTCYRTAISLAATVNRASMFQQSINVFPSCLNIVPCIFWFMSFL